jgi:superfamily II DNA/RNA helicase
LPLLQRLQIAAREPPPVAVRSLIVVPTRELAAQVGEVVRGLAQALPQPPKVVVASGGVSINPQLLALRGGADVLVATPGRLLDLVGQNAVQLATVRRLVLDEADRLLDLGFAEELARVITLLPPRRQNLFFSATFPPEVRGLAGRLLHDPIDITVPVEEQAQPEISQRAIAVDAGKRTQLLRHLIVPGGHVCWCLWQPNTRQNWWPRSSTKPRFMPPLSMVT